MSPAFPADAARELVRRALDEDLGRGGDVTTRAVVPPGSHAVAQLVAREELVLAGLPLARLVLDEMAARGAGTVAVDAVAGEGAAQARGAVLARLAGDAAALLAGERVLLNLVGRLSGIATLTARAVAEVAGTGATVADTRKTTPGLRALEKYAVACGGGENHRFGLDAMILVKDNHKMLAGGIDAVLDRLAASGADLGAAEVEVDSLAEFDRVLASGVGWILLDNFSVDDVIEARRRAAARGRTPWLEVSGGLRPGNLRAYAEAGVQRLSLGSLTHGARSVDVALDFEAAPR